MLGVPELQGGAAHSRSHLRRTRPNRNLQITTTCHLFTMEKLTQQANLYLAFRMTTSSSLKDRFKQFDPPHHCRPPRSPALSWLKMYWPMSSSFCGPTRGVRAMRIVFPKKPGTKTISRHPLPFLENDCRDSVGVMLWASFPSFSILDYTKGFLQALLFRDFGSVIQLSCCERMIQLQAPVLQMPHRRKGRRVSRGNNGWVSSIQRVIKQVGNIRGKFYSRAATSIQDKRPFHCLMAL
ncbi:hypothetical protein HDK90DRAFT_295692 [Phyllosticta capitalensis]|uniref:Uncharacterized protein n=1 Tax=Phyllosticta capitalensis TaxID=121624 RepID=A0ABR1YJV1_9PEZI